MPMEHRVPDPRCCWIEHGAASLVPPPKSPRPGAQARSTGQLFGTLVLLAAVGLGLAPVVVASPAPGEHSRVWEMGSGFRRASLRVPEGGHPGFTLLAPEQTGIRFTNHLSNRAAAQNQIRLV